MVFIFKRIRAAVVPVCLLSHFSLPRSHGPFSGRPHSPSLCDTFSFSLPTVGKRSFLCAFRVSLSPRVSFFLPCLCLREPYVTAEGSCEGRGRGSRRAPAGSCPPLPLISAGILHGSFRLSTRLPPRVSAAPPGL